MRLWTAAAARAFQGATILSCVLAFALGPCDARAQVSPWEAFGGTNEVVLTLDIDCAGGGLVCDVLDAYTDTQTATLTGEGEVRFDLAAGTFQFLQDGTVDLMDGMGLRPAYATLQASDVTFAEIPFVGAPETRDGSLFALSDAPIATGGPLTPGDHPFSAVVSYSSLADIVGPVDAYLPYLAVEPTDVALTGVLRVLSVSPAGVSYQLRDVMGTLDAQNPTTLLGEDVVVSVSAQMTMNLVGVVPVRIAVPALSASSLVLLVMGMAACGAIACRPRTARARWMQ